jgi:GNAT superfamily N-acetyltransferase
MSATTSAQRSTEITYLPYSPTRLPETVALMNRVQGGTVTAAEFEWWFERTPGGARNIYLAELDGAVVGCLALVPYQMMFDGRTETVGVGQKLCVDEVCRGKGVFLSMQRHLEHVARDRGIRLFIGFPNAKAHEIWTRKWDVLDLPQKRLLVRVERPAILLARLGAPMALAGVFDRPYRTLVGRAQVDRGCTLRSVTRFDATADSLWSRIAGDLTRGTGYIARTAAYLNWRYFDGPATTFRATCAYDHGEMVGYVVTTSVMKSGVRLGVIADLITVPDSRVRSALLDHALAELRKVGVAATTVLDPIDATHRVLYLSRLLLPSPKRVPIICKALDGDADRTQRFLDPHCLQFSLGDLDFV